MPARMLIAMMALLLGLGGCTPLAAQQPDEKAYPHWASIRDKIARSRVGPGLDYRIRWEYVRQGLPVRVIKAYGDWRQIEDPDGSQGWMHRALLLKAPTAYVKGEIAPMREQPSADSRVLWKLAPGVVGKILQCAGGWCRLDVGGRVGYVRGSQLWGPTESGN